MKRILIIVAATALALIAFTHFSQGAAEDAPEAAAGGEVDYRDIPLTEAQVRAAGIRLGAVEDRDIPATLAANGSIVLRAKDKATVASLMGGIVKRLYVTDGQRVAKGQVVALVENTDVVSLQREYYAASQDCEFAREELLRQQALAAGGAGVGRSLEQARRDHSIARARARGIAQQLAQLGVGTAGASRGRFQSAFPVKAPISGTVSGIAATLGGYADMQTPLMAIRDNRAVECDLHVYERDIDKVRVGDRVALTVTNSPGTRASGRVYGVNRYFTDGTKSVKVHVRLDPAGRAGLFDGQYVSGAITIGRRRGKAVPTGAIVRSGGRSYVFALNGRPGRQGYRFSRHEVTAGPAAGGYTAVTFHSPLAEGRQVVTANALYLASMTGDHGEE